MLSTKPLLCQKVFMDHFTVVTTPAFMIIRKVKYKCYSAAHLLIWLIHGTTQKQHHTSLRSTHMYSVSQWAMCHMCSLHKFKPFQYSIYVNATLSWSRKLGHRYSTYIGYMPCDCVTVLYICVCVYVCIYNDILITIYLSIT